jgi:hypothetical protein
MNDNDEGEFYIHAFSNADTEKNKDNTLTSFINNLPLNFELPCEERWCVCVQSVGFASKFHSISIPEDINTPSIIIESNINNNLEQESQWVHEANIFFPSKFSDIETIKKSLAIIYEKNLGIDFLLSEDENIRIMYVNNEKEHLYYKLIIHEEIVKSFGLPKKNAKSIKNINKNIYFEFIISSSSPIIHSYLKRWNFKHPNLVRIQCEQITEQIFNSKLTRDLKIFCPSFEMKEKYTFHQFDSEEYVPLSNSVLDKLSFNICDEHDNLLDIDYGVSTFIKLKFKKMNSQPDSFNVRLSPDENQSCSDFTIDLPQPYYLDSSWKVSLSSICYANIFRPLPYEEKSRTIHTAKLIDNSQDHRDLHIIPNLLYSHSGIISEINRAINKNHDNANFTTREFEEYGEKKVKVSVRINGETVMVLSKDMCELLGLNYAIDVGSDNIVKSEESQSICFINSELNPVTVDFSNFFDINKFRPQYMMIYTDIINQSVVGNSFSNLIKIAPVYHESTDAYKTQEFKNNEFHSLENTLIKQIRFQIRSHSGNYINFMEGSKIFVNLLFSKMK